MERFRECAVSEANVEAIATLIYMRTEGGVEEGEKGLLSTLESFLGEDEVATEVGEFQKVVIQVKRIVMSKLLLKALFRVTRWFAGEENSAAAELRNILKLGVAELSGACACAGG